MGTPEQRRRDSAASAQPAAPAAETWTIGRLLAVDDRVSQGPSVPRARGWTPKCCWPTPWAASGSSSIRPSTSVPSEAQRTAFRELVRRRADGMPVAYLVGRREFYSLSFRVSPGVLIPRPETELLVVTLLDLAKARGTSPLPPGEGRGEGVLEVADVGTGSGILAVCAAKHLPACRVTAIDTSPAALAIAAANAAEHGVAERIEFRRGRPAWRTCRPSRNSTSSSAIRLTSARRNIEKLPREVKNFEPREALLAGPLGTEVIARLIPQAAERLRGRRALAPGDQPHDPRRGPRDSRRRAAPGAGPDDQGPCPVAAGAHRPAARHGKLSGR